MKAQKPRKVEIDEATCEKIAEFFYELFKNNPGISKGIKTKNNKS